MSGDGPPYYGAVAAWPPISLESLPRYTKPQPLGQNFQFTPPAGQSQETIDAIHARVMNQHPERISALADEWQNAYNLMASIKQQLADDSGFLYNEAWRNGDARDAFMRAGPGTTIAYLDEWMNAVHNNVRVLRDVVHLAIDSRQRMAQMWDDFQREVNDAYDISAGEAILGGIENLVVLNPDKVAAGIINKHLEEVSKKYNQKARDFAWNLANDYMVQYSRSSSGYGPPFTPMDVVLNPFGHPKYIAPPSMPGGPPSMPPAIPAPVPVAPTDPSQLQRAVLANLQTVPNVPTFTNTGVAGPPALAGLPGIDPALLAAQAAANPALMSARAPAIPTPQTGLQQQPGFGAPPNPGGLRNGVLRGPGAGGGSAGLGSSMPGNPLRPGLKRPGKSADGEGAQQAMSEEAEAAFGRSPGGTTPPILKSPTRDVRRLGGQFASPPPISVRGTPIDHPDAVKPVLNARPTDVPRRPPAPPARTDRDRRQQTPGGGVLERPDWLGQDQIMAGATPGVVDTPPSAAGATVVTGLQEVPSPLRSPAAAAAARAARLTRKAGALAPELASRRTAETPTEQRGADEERGVVTDEEAFTVETPGGGVVTNQGEQVKQAEPPPTLGRA